MLREDIIQRLKEEKYFEDLNKKLDKQAYRMKKDELFRRMQIEKNEKAFHECLCKVTKFCKKKSMVYYY